MLGEAAGRRNGIIWKERHRRAGTAAALPLPLNARRGCGEKAEKQPRSLHTIQKNRFLYSSKATFPALLHLVKNARPTRRLL